MFVLKSAVGVISLIAAIITIGDFSVKALSDADVSLYPSIAFLIIVILIQMVFVKILNLNLGEDDTYIPLVYGITLPCVIVLCYVSYALMMNKPKFEFSTYRIKPTEFKSISSKTEVDTQILYDSTFRSSADAIKKAHEVLGDFDKSHNHKLAEGLTMISDDKLMPFLESLKYLGLIFVVFFLFIAWSRLCDYDLRKSTNYISLSFGIPSILGIVIGLYFYSFVGLTLDRYFPGLLLLILTPVSLGILCKEVL